MAKMFYTEAETKKKLNASNEELKQFVRESRLREFRDGPRLMFKADQVDSLADKLHGSGLLDLTRESDDEPLSAELLDIIAPKEREQMNSIQYEFDAMNSSGQEVKDTLIATSTEDAIRQIRQQGLFPTKVKESNPNMFKKLFGKTEMKHTAPDKTIHRAYEHLEAHPQWELIKQAVKDLEENKDLIITTNVYYIVGYLLKKLTQEEKKS